MKFLWSLIASLIALGLTTTPGSAATCGGPLIGNNVLFTVTGTNPGCFGSGDGQINLASQQPFGASYVYLDKTGSTTDPNEGALIVTGIAEGDKLKGPGNWQIIPSLVAGYTNFVLLFQQSNNPNRTPDWAAFSLNSNGGTWIIQALSGNGNSVNSLSLSHAILYGVETPLPGALLLFGTVLLGSGGIARWRKFRERMAA